MLMSGFLYSWKKSIAASQQAFEKQDAHEKSNLRFSIDPAHGESGFSQWKTAMKMVVQLPEGIPAEFRRKLWINLSEKYLSSRNVNWDKVEAECFSEWANPADTELDVQIVKDLHRTGCSLFCGENGQEKQAVLKKVLLAYARWNKHVGYCQGFNMLAALILQVTEGCEFDALKIMIFLIEGVLPESYFADSLRGLSVDMVVFRELLKTRLPLLSNHLEKLQHTTNDGSISYEPPLTNVFTMQWFLTIFCNCLPHTTVLRVWDLIFLEGNDVLLRAALCIWQLLEERIMTVRNADEFYCIMGVLTREMLELDLVDANALVELIMEMGPLKELRNLREKYLYNINPWAPSSNSNANEVDRQLKLYQKENLKLDISALKKQYLKLKHRQRQAHIIFTAAINKQPPPSTPPIAINHLLLGKSAILPTKRIGPPKGSIPPPRQVSQVPVSPTEVNTCDTLLWRDAERRKLSTSSSSSSDTELCDDSDDNEDLDEKTVVSEVKKTETEDVVEDYKSEITNHHLLVDLDEDHFIPSSSTGIRVEETKEDDQKIETADSSDDEELDELYFEQFLKKRVETLKGSDVTTPADENTQETSRIGAKESRQRAFEIIQENSMILHRILQCQQQSLSSQLNSPEKPDEKSDISTEKVEEDAASTIFLQEDLHFERMSDYNTSYKYSEEEQSTVLESMSKCSPILSEDLESQLYDVDLSESYSYQEDNRTGSPPKIPEFDFTLSIKDDDPSPSRHYSDDVESKEDLSKDELDNDYSRALEKKYEELVLKPRRPSFLEIYEKNSVSCNEENIDRQNTKSNEKTEEIANGQAVNLMEKRYYPMKRSPTKSPTSDPFPVRILSRQNKDVCIRLGLYKKS